MLEKIHILNRVNILKLRAAQRYNISPDKCHIGHLVLQGLLDNPKMIHQIDAATDTNETCGSVALRSIRLASALNNTGMVPGDVVVIMAPNHLDLTIAFYASNYNGYSVCGIDPNIGLADLKTIYPNIMPQVTFCQKSSVEHVKQAYESANIDGKIVVFDDEDKNMNSFIQEWKGSEINFRPAEFDHSAIAALLILTSGTTGRSKVVVTPFDKILNAVLCWWEPFTADFQITMSMSSFQWISALLYFISTPLRRFTRLQFSAPITPQLLVKAINKYRPNTTAWTPHFLGQFLDATEDICDMSCFRYICVTGSPIEKVLIDKFRERCRDAFLYLVYGMTELLVPGFDYREDTPLGSIGKPFNMYTYKLVDDNGKIVTKSYEHGELYIKGDVFFKGYLNNPEETNKIVTPDGWFKTEDIFYRDDDNNYYFVERRRLLIRYCGFWVSPLQLEEVIKKHPAIKNVCVVSLPDVKKMEVPVAAVVRQNGHDIPPNELFNLVRASLPETKHLHGGFFYVESIPYTPTGKVHRAKVKEMAFTANRILPVA